MKRRATLLCLVLVGQLSSTGLAAAERIRSFYSEITIDADSDMRVEETIRVLAEGRNIRRGIYRDFPTDYTDEYGNAFKVDFSVGEVRRDGVKEEWHTQRLANGVRLYMGSETTLLEPGTYTYTVVYRTHRQIGYFEDHDELYWNVTGNGWAFPIDEVSAAVLLPEPVPAASLSMSGYTGGSGSKGQNYVTSVTRGEAYIHSTRAFEAGEGLTLVASWPKGVVWQPSRWQRLIYLLQDNLGLLLALAALILSTLYLHRLWNRYGRDPEAGVIFPHYEPPAGYSPASSRYITRMAYDGPVLAAAVLNLAVKGYLSIGNEHGHYQLHRLASTQKLAAGESTLMGSLFVSGDDLELDKANHSIIGGARTAHRKALQRDYMNIYFRRNAAKLLPSALASLAIAAVIAVLDLFTPLVAAVLLAIAGIHALYAYLLRAPTPRGRLLLDQLQGFKLYLEVAEQEDLNRRHPPTKTPELFERFLPFAVALGVEQAWAEQFADVFSSIQAQQQTPYQPAWYRGSFQGARLGSFASDVGKSFSSAISSAATPPGSSSGGSGGGSSGGGGGGGGGGGW